MDFSKLGGLIPAIAQDAVTGKVLMLGFMNQEAYDKTLETNLVTFYSRSRHYLWTKGETSGNYLHVKEILSDCDNDTILIKVIADGPVCHTGQDTCFGESNAREGIEFLDYLQKFIQRRHEELPEGSYTTKLFKSGINRMAQKVGEEAVETVIEAKDDNDDLFIGEASDLIYHLIVLLTAKGKSLNDIAKRLESRHK